MAGHVTEVRGIEVALTADALNDFEVVECIADTTDESLTDAERLSAVVRLFRLAFGEDFARVKRELRAANGGRLTMDDMQGFFTECLKAVGAKN